MPMLSLVGFQAVHKPPLMNDADTIEVYTGLTAADHLGWVHSDRWFLNEYTRGLHKSLRTLGQMLRNDANTNRRNINSAYPARFAPAKLAHTFLDLIASCCPTVINISAIPARQLASSLPVESIFQFDEEDIPLAEGDHVIAAIEPGRPGRYKPRLRFQNKIDAAGNKLCNVCGSSSHLYATCPARPNPANAVGTTVFKGYQLEVAGGSDETFFEYVRRVVFYDISSDFQ